MLQAAELGQSVDKDEYEDAVARLRVDLVNAQYDLQSADFPVVILIGGSDQLAAREALRGMHEWADGRYIDSNVFEQPNDEEMRRPEFWRYWRRLPRKGRIARGCDADLLIVDQDNRIEGVMARGAWHVKNGRQLVSGLFEE